MRIVTSIFCLPHEIDDLEILLHQLRSASHHLSEDVELVLDVTLCLSDNMVNWKKSSLPKVYFEEKLLKLSAYIDWSVKYIRTSTDILGEVSHRRESFETHYEDATHFIWLNTNVIFPEKTLFYLEQSLKQTSEHTPYHIVTPEMVQMWDESWSNVVNEKFKTKSLNYQSTNNPYIDNGIYGEVEIVEVKNTLPRQPRYKFLGGVFTCISKPLLKRVGIPESFGHHGFDDTFLMWSSEKLTQTTDIEVQQFKMKNVVICENYKYLNNAHYLNNLSVFDRREQFQQISESNFSKELQNVK